MNNNVKKVIIAITIVLAIIIGIFFINNKQKANQKELTELKELKIKLETQKNDIFMKYGLCEEFYKINEELNDINKEIQDKEFSTSPISMFSILFGVVFILVFTTIITTIFNFSKNHIKMSPGDIIDDHTINQMEKMVSMLSKVSVDMVKEVNPEYKSLKCPNCGAPLADNVETCEYCDTPLTKVVGSKK